MNFLVLDIETTGLNPKTDRIHGIGFATDTDADYLEANDERIKAYLANPENHVIGHNIRFDLKFLIANGFTVKARIWDTKIMAQLLDENRLLGLKDLSGEDKLEAKREIDRAVSQMNGRSVADLCRADLDDPSRPYKNLIARYCVEDCNNTLELFHKLSEELKIKHIKMQDKGFKDTVLTYFTEESMPLEKVLIDMELKGIKVNEDQLRDFKAKLTLENDYLLTQLNELCIDQITNIEGELYEEEVAKRKTIKGMSGVQKSSTRYGTKFNWQSNDHLSALIFDEFGVSKKGVEKTKTGKPSTSESSLEKLCETLQETDPLHKVLTTYKTYKKNQKLITTYTGEDKGLLSQLEGGRVYAEYLQAGRGREGSSGGTVTGRLSSRNPNMQNLPRGSEIKSFFVPDTDDDVFVYFDYSQLELRLAAHLSRDPLLIKAYNDNLDLHELTAQAIGADRQVGKTTNFAMIYDASAYRLASILNKSVDESQEIINNFYSLYKGYKKYLQKQMQFMIVNGLVISEAGRIRRLPEVQTLPTYSKEWKHAVKQGYNFPIQSLGASITKRAMIELHKRGFNIVTQVHDSVVIQLPKTDLHKVEEIQMVAETIYPLTVPLKVEIKLLTSLLESDKIQIEGVNHEQCSDSKQNKGSI